MLQPPIPPPETWVKYSLSGLSSQVKHQKISNSTYGKSVPYLKLDFYLTLQLMGAILIKRKMNRFNSGAT
jgi:hypothetical protein